MPRLIIILNDKERDALNEFAEREMRDPRMQAALIIRRALEIEGLISADDSDIFYSVENVALPKEDESQ